MANQDLKGLDKGWFGRVPGDFRVALIGAGHIRRLPAGHHIQTFDDIASTFFGLAEGQLAIALPIAGEELIVHVGSPGLWIGAPIISSQEPRRAESIVARTEVILFVVPLPSLRALLKKNPAWWQLISLYQAFEFDLFASALIDLMHRRHRARLLSVLTRLAGLRPEPRLLAPDLTLHISQEELAAMSNCSHNFANAELKALADARQIALGYRSIRILDPAALMTELQREIGAEIATRTK